METLVLIQTIGVWFLVLSLIGFFIVLRQLIRQIEIFNLMDEEEYDFNELLKKAYDAGHDCGGTHEGWLDFNYKQFISREGKDEK